MTAALAKYHNRSPRYTLNTEDNCLIRYSGHERLPWEENTEIKNISLTGLSFVAHVDLSPILGEIIKIQFAVPGGQQMACYAVIIRLDRRNDYENLIAVHFYKLDRLQRLNLLQGLSQTTKIEDPKQPQVVMAKVIAVVGLFFTALCWFTLMKIYFSKG
ncbi:MAG: PilZ domain-containing protein [Bdellovibrio sp.]|nr:PilZ domain-containing protein [Bdellovibrio sp.]